MSDDQRQERVKQMLESMQADWDKKPVLLAEEISTFLDSIKDQGSHIDSGTDGVSGDLWVKVQDVEYYINIRKSNKQLAKDGLQAPDAEMHEMVMRWRNALEEIMRLTGETTMSTWDTHDGGSRKKINEIATTALK